MFSFVMNIGIVNVGDDSLLKTIYYKKNSYSVWESNLPVPVWAY